MHVTTNQATSKVGRNLVVQIELELSLNALNLTDISQCQYATENSQKFTRKAGPTEQQIS